MMTKVKTYYHKATVGLDGRYILILPDASSQKDTVTYSVYLLRPQPAYLCALVASGKSKKAARKTAGKLATYIKARGSDLDREITRFTEELNSEIAQRTDVT